MPMAAEVTVLLEGASDVAAFFCTPASAVSTPAECGSSTPVASPTSEGR